MVFKFLNMVVICLFVLLFKVIVILNNKVNIIICSILLFVIVLIGLVGNILIMICVRVGVFLVL